MGREGLWLEGSGRLIFIHHQCWEVLPICHFQRQRCIKILCPKDPDFYAPLALKTAKGQHLPALVVYKNQSPRKGPPVAMGGMGGDPPKTSWGSDPHLGALDHVLFLGVPPTSQSAICSAIWGPPIKEITRW